MGFISSTYRTIRARSYFPDRHFFFFVHCSIKYTIISIHQIIRARLDEKKYIHFQLDCGDCVFDVNLEKKNKNLFRGIDNILSPEAPHIFFFFILFHSKQAAIWREYGKKRRKNWQRRRPLTLQIHIQEACVDEDRQRQTAIDSARDIR